MLTKTFIKEVFGEQIEAMTMGKDGKTPYPYLGFSMVSQCIEVLGACFDEYDWEDHNLSGLRFRLAIKMLFPEKYQQFSGKKLKIDLFKNLRCPMVHQMRPGKNIGLSERKHQRNDASLIHLTQLNGQLILIYEDFLEDFKRASNKLVEMNESGQLTTQKVTGHNLSVPSDYE